MAETLQEFVVSLKYQQEGEQGVINSVEKVGGTVLRVGAAIATAMTGVALAVSKYAQSMEQLDFIAIRTKTTVDNLRALQTAGASLGSTAGGMQSSLEGVSRFMRNNPGSSGFLASMGVQTKDAQGKELDHAQIMKNIGKSFRGMSQPMANLYAQRLGIDENSELALRDPNFDHNYDVDRGHLGHLDETAKLSNTAVNHGRVAGLSAEDLAARAAKPVLDAFNKLDTATGGLSTQIGAAVVGVTALGTAAATAAKLWKAIMPAAAGAAEGGAGSAAGAATGAAVGTAASVATKLLPFVKGASAIGMLTYSSGLNEGEDAQTAAGWAHRKYLQSRGIPIRLKPVGMAHNQDAGMIRHIAPAAKDDTVSKLMGMGFSKNEAIGLHANFIAESGMNPNAVGDHGHAYGIGQWQEPRQASFKKLFGRSMKGSSVDDQLKFAKIELDTTESAARSRLRSAARVSPSAAARAGSVFYERPFDVAGQAAQRGKIAAGIQQNINVTINGASDPKATGREVHRQIQLLARNTAGSVR